MTVKRVQQVRLAYDCEPASVDPRWSLETTTRELARASPAQMEVDTVRREQLHIVFNLTFPGLPCEALTMDVVDASGTYESDDTIRLARHSRAAPHRTTQHSASTAQLQAAPARRRLCCRRLCVRRRRNGEVHKYTLDRDGRRLGRTEYVAPNHGGWGSLSPFILAIDQQVRAARGGGPLRGWAAPPRAGWPPRPAACSPPRHAGHRRRQGGNCAARGLQHFRVAGCRPAGRNPALYG